MQTQTNNETLTPAARWNLTEVARVQVGGATYVVVDDGTYRTAVLAETFDAETAETDYSVWCAAHPGVGDETLCARIARAAELKGLVTSGACVWVNAAADADEVAARLGNDGQTWMTDDGVEFAELVADAHREYQRRGDADGAVRYTFPDGSVLTAIGGAWDLGYADCWCRQGEGHSDECVGGDV